jgi:hypothetical protein
MRLSVHFCKEYSPVGIWLTLHLLPYFNVTVVPRNSSDECTVTIKAGWLLCEFWMCLFFPRKALLPEIWKLHRWEPDCADEEFAHCRVCDKIYSDAIHLKPIHVYEAFSEILPTPPMAGTLLALAVVVWQIDMDAVLYEAHGWLGTVFIELHKRQLLEEIIPIVNQYYCVGVQVIYVGIKDAEKKQQADLRRQLHDYVASKSSIRIN